MNKTLFIVLAISFSMSSAFAKAKDCSLFLADPKITHTTYGSNSGNPVNNGVIRILQKNGFTISTNELKAHYVMKTEVRCGQAWTMFGLQDSCQTSISFEDTKQEKIAYTDGPTAPMAGLNIDFNNVNFPKCSDL
jgi:hypothetical protein